MGNFVRFKDINKLLADTTKGRDLIDDALFLTMVYLIKNSRMVFEGNCVSEFLECDYIGVFQYNATKDCDDCKVLFHNLKMLEEDGLIGRMFVHSVKGNKIEYMIHIPFANDYAEYEDMD